MDDSWRLIRSRLAAIRRRQRILSTWSMVCVCIAMSAGCLILGVALAAFVRWVVPAETWLAIAASDPRWHWVADGSAEPGSRPATLIAAVLALGAVVLFLLQRITRRARARRVNLHPLESAACRLAVVNAVAGETARSLLRLPQDVFHSAMCQRLAPVIDAIHPAEVIPSLPARLMSMVMLAAVMLVLALARPLHMQQAWGRLGEAIAGMSGSPGVTWVVLAPPDPQARPFLLVVRPVPRSGVSDATGHPFRTDDSGSTAAPRLVVESATRRRVIELEPVGRDTYMARFNSVSRPVSLTVIGGGRTLKVEPASQSAAPR